MQFNLNLETRSNCDAICQTCTANSIGLQWDDSSAYSYGSSCGPDMCLVCFHDLACKCARFKSLKNVDCGTSSCAHSHVACDFHKSAMYKSDRQVIIG